jgi:hypothetical protein
MKRRLPPAWLAATVLFAGAEAAATPAQTIEVPPLEAPQAAPSPNARHFLYPPWFAYWAGTERLLEGELAPVSIRPLENGRLLPALDDKPHTSAFMRGVHTGGSNGLEWTLLELGSLHELQGGGVLATHFRLDERESRAEQGFVVLTLPIRRLRLVPLAGFGAKSDVTSRFVVGSELRSNREREYGFSGGFEVSGWTEDRHRLLGKVGGIYRLSSRAAIEERVAVGAWLGPRVGGDVAMHWISGHLQNFSKDLTMYERLTLARGVPAPSGPQRDDTSSWSLDVAVGSSYDISPNFGFALQVDAGTQPSRYRRMGVELTFYGTAF